MDIRIFKVLYLFIFVSVSSISCQKERANGIYDYKTLGTSARDLLSSSIYSSLKIQISYMPGFEPDSITTNAVSVFLNTFLNKPDGIQISKQCILESGKEVIDLSEIVDIEKKNRSTFTSGSQIAIHILITDSYFSNSQVFANSYWNTSICIFGRSVSDNSGRLGQIGRTDLLITLIEHELGHLMGLVNQGSPMQVEHLDSLHSDHCDNPKCLMYYRQNPDNYGIINNYTVPELDSNCKNDLKANGGK